MNRDLYSFRETPEPLSPEELELKNPKTLLELTISPQGSFEEKIWDENKEQTKTYQLLRNTRTNQLAVIGWPSEAFGMKEVEGGLREFTQPEEYRTSYGQMEEIDLCSPSELEEKITKARTRYPLEEEDKNDHNHKPQANDRPLAAAA
ncbi:hypothetical protein HYV70_04410 [Candidatus Uhrbacteria bacterium]|nr:hypothetical protein [Candidatus Uhrbacteria bacterium]